MTLSSLRPMGLLRYLHIFSVMVLFALVAGCSTVPVAPSGQADTGEFSRAGRFAINVQYHNGQRDAVQGGFSWVDVDQQLQLDLHNPMGSILARVVVSQHGATLYRTDGSSEYAPSPDALVEQVLGSPIPVSKLRYWLRGVAAETARNVELADAQQPASFTDDGWRVRLQRYDEQGPRLLTLNRNDAQGDISVRLVIDN